MEYMYITNEQSIAKIADEIGIDRVWVDLEILGKEERQKGYNSVISYHTVHDVLNIKKILRNAKLQVRINPINDNSKKEINQVLDYGADIIMLPYYKTLREIHEFIDMVSGRAKTVLLLETKEACEILDNTLNIPGVDEIHIGLNDLHLAYNKKFMFELLVDGLVDTLCKKIKAKNIPFGFGGIARLGHGTVPAEYILPEHYRLGSTRVILSRSFYNANVDTNPYTTMKESMDALRCYENKLRNSPISFFEHNHEQVKKIVEKIINES